MPLRKWKMGGDLDGDHGRGAEGEGRRGQRLLKEDTPKYADTHPHAQTAHVRSRQGMPASANGPYLARRSFAFLLFLVCSLVFEVVANT